MNCKLFTLAFIMCCLGSSAIAGPASHAAPGERDTNTLSTPAVAAEGIDDTLNMYRITFSQPIRKVVLEDYCNLVIVPDTLNFLTTSRPSKKGISDKTFSYRLTSAGELKIESLPSGRQLELHMDMGTSVAIETNDFTNAEVHINSQLNMLEIKTNDYSNVLVTTDLDTIRATTIKITTNDFSNAKFNAPVNSYSLSLKSNDFSNAKLPSGRINKIFESQSENATINYGHLPNVDIYMGDESEYNDSDASASRKPEKPAKRSSIFYDGGWEFDFAWGFTNWGRRPWNSFNPMQGPYGLSTNFSSYQLELVYYPLCSRHFRIGMGVGYASDVYHFNNDYVSLTELPNHGPMDFVSLIRDDAQWSTRMVARYFTIPISIIWKPSASSDFSIGVAALPGLNYSSRHTGLKHKGESSRNQGKVTDVENMSAVMNPLKLDARLTLNYSHISVFVQMSTLPIMQHMKEEVYPIKLGLILRAFND